MQISVKTGRPNACHLCHLDKSLAWTANALSDWHKIPKPKLSLWLVSFTALRPAVGADFGLGGPGQFTCWHDGRSVGKELYSTLHNQGANLTFVDGHAEYRKAAQLRAKHFGLADGPSGKAEDTQKVKSTVIYRSALAP